MSWRVLKVLMLQQCFHTCARDMAKKQRMLPPTFSCGRRLESCLLCGVTNGRAMRGVNGVHEGDLPKEQTARKA
eukprot:6173193-Pleurochrysis_carterae.AAC.1